ncbi:hypothetical protein SAMN05192574_11835 [Mucilaginibacter gossypiicola]|uniref:Uncharacterized protein n=1 Tax=Mucilaginibacter gossypiicola TaxID=551995 RepID=A0A1H8U6U5_9SPHI|nr:hypothetical protein SAMN05192574_11835 [Mucilaginibacter gossypiicola]
MITKQYHPHKCLITKVVYRWNFKNEYKSNGSNTKIALNQ